MIEKKIKRDLIDSIQRLQKTTRETAKVVNRIINGKWSEETKQLARETLHNIRNSYKADKKLLRNKLKEYTDL